MRAKQMRDLHKYADRRGWTIATQIRKVGSGAVKRQAREQLLNAERRREIDVVVVWPFRYRPRHASGTGASRRRFRIAHGSAGSDHPGGRTMAPPTA